MAEKKDSQQSHSLYDLTEAEVLKLAKVAVEAKEKAYCPYSAFRVGAAVLSLSEGCTAENFNARSHTQTILSGSNVEVASTPVGICAERCAIAPLVASSKRPHLPVIRAIAVSTDIWPPASPCGMCRQMIREFCEPDVRIFMYGRKADINYAETKAEDEARVQPPTVMTIGELLPLSFGPNDMDKRDQREKEKVKRNFS